MKVHVACWIGGGEGGGFSLFVCRDITSTLTQQKAPSLVCLFVCLFVEWGRDRGFYGHAPPRPVRCRTLMPSFM